MPHIRRSLYQLRSTAASIRPLTFRYQSRLLFVIACTVITQCQVNSAQDVKLHIRPDDPLMDEPVEILIVGLTPHQSVELRAMTVISGKVWRSKAAFVADSKGEINVGKQNPVKGTWSSADPMGFIWSMEPAAEPPPKDMVSASQVTDPRVTNVELSIDGQVVASHLLKRWLARPGVRISAVNEDDLVGKLFEPAERGRRPAVLVLSGSEGGMRETEAALLASRGYTALALAYFGSPNRPQQLVKIPLEYLKSGLDWLRARDSVDPDRIGVVGGSKGGELALVLASRYPEIKAVVATVPSHIAWSGIGGTYREASWTLGGEPVPYATTRPTPDFFAKMSKGEPATLIELYRAGMADEAAVEAALIRVEKIQGAVMLISGTDDQMWPSAEMCDKIIERLKKHNHPFPFEHLRYDGAGHGIVNAFIPLKNSIVAGNFALGGTVEANARAVADSRPKMLKFLADGIGK
jgi:dienelactone hydrolase